MNFGALASKVGGTIKEAARGSLSNGLINLTGQGAMTGQVKYAEYEYDTNGHIKGVNSKYAKEVEDKYEKSGVYNTTGIGIDGNFGGLTIGKSRQAKKDFIYQYPGKFDSTKNVYDNYLSSKYTNQQNELELAEAEYSRSESELYSYDKNDYKETEREAAMKQLEDNVEKSKEKYNNIKKDYDTYASFNGLIYNNVSTENYNKYNASDNQNRISNNPISDVFSIKLPDWTYADFINERAIWQKGLSSIFDEPGWFYFKIFFDFDTDHGLFGGLLNSKYLTNSVNSAAKYLYTIRKLHKFIKPQDRINSLYKFASILSYINTNAPWYFKSVKGLNKAANPIINDFGKENTIELEVTQDAIDMRLSTLMSLYNYACFDAMTDREIIPPNLRKFNMSIIIFQTPLRYLHTSFTSNKKTELIGIDIRGAINEVGSLLGKKKKTSSIIKYKSMNPNGGFTGDYSNVMSMKVYSFFGCEFDKESFSDIIPGSISNEKPFQLGNSSIKISYTSCTEHSMNEFYAMMFGSDGFYFNQYSNYQLVTHDGESWNGYIRQQADDWNKQLDRYQSLYDTFEDIARGGTVLGLVDKPKTYKKAIDATEAIMNGLFDNPGLLKGLATNFALGLIGSSKNTNAPQGNIYGDYGIGSAYYTDKLEMLKNGIHERTTAPYYYDPDTGVKYEFHKNRTYLAYNLKNDISTIKSFDVNNFLQTNTQKYALRLNDTSRNELNKVFHNDSDFTQQPYKHNQYNKDTAQKIDTKKWEGYGKNHDMIDDQNSWNRVTKPFNYESEHTLKYENSKISKSDLTKNQILANDLNDWKRVRKPYQYDQKNALEIENDKSIDVSVSKINSKSVISIVESPFNYDPKEALSYENNKAGGQYKIQNMVVTENKFTMPHYSIH